MMDGALPGSVAACHPPGWFDQFVKYVKRAPEGPVLLLLHGYYTHTHTHTHTQGMYKLLKRQEKIILQLCVYRLIHHIVCNSRMYSSCFPYKHIMRKK
jgi:hypothetical protein